MSRHVFVGVFEDEADVVAAANASRAEALDIVDAYTPYAVHVATSSTPTPRVRASRISLPTMRDSSSGSRRRTAATASETRPSHPAGTSSFRPPTRLNM